MIIPDVNMLLYATISGYPQHARARAWWERSVNSGDIIGLTAPSVFGFLRISTNGRILESPMTVFEATGTVMAWLEEPNIESLTHTPATLKIAFDLLRTVGAAGNLTTDAHIAAYALEYRAEVHSNDTDFARFADVTWINPLK